MTIVDGAGKIASTEQSPPKVSAAKSPPERAEPVSATLSSDTAPEDFDESAYLAAFPDVARAIKTGEILSALHHYDLNGQREGRLADPRYQALVRADTAGFPAAYVDRVYGCKDGQCLVLGWVSDDEQDPVSKLVLRNALGLRGSTTAFYRYIREDVTSYLELPEHRRLAFWAIVAIERPETMRAPAELTLSVGAKRKTFECQIHPVDEE